MYCKHIFFLLNQTKGVTNKIELDQVILSTGVQDVQWQIWVLAAQVHEHEGGKPSEHVDCTIVHLHQAPDILIPNICLRVTVNFQQVLNSPVGPF